MVGTLEQASGTCATQSDGARECTPWRHLINIPNQEGMSMSWSIVANGAPSLQSSQPDIPQLTAIYTRVSTTDQADKGYSLPTQIEACQAMARQEGYTCRAGTGPLGR